MRIAALLNADQPRNTPGLVLKQHCNVLSQPLTVGVFELARPKARVLQDHEVLVNVTAISYNYRDWSLIAPQAKSIGLNEFKPFGSEFVGTVAAVGKRVENLATGNRVMADSCFPSSEQVRGGVASNFASRQDLVVPVEKLMRVPEGMDDATAAAFSIGAQTAMSMARRSEVLAGDVVAVLAGSSSTSLFLIQILAASGIDVTAITTNAAAEPTLHGAGATTVAVWDSQDQDLARSHPTYDFIFDPFFDVHAPLWVSTLRSGGCYVTCGVARTVIDNGPKLAQAVAALIVGNVRLVGNCLGTSDDLARAIELFADAKLRPVIDSVHPPDGLPASLVRAFDDRSKIGKVVYALSGNLEVAAGGI